jgi:hypothetical protein
MFRNNSCRERLFCWNFDIFWKVPTEFILKWSMKCLLQENTNKSSPVLQFSKICLSVSPINKRDVGKWHHDAVPIHVNDQLPDMDKSQLSGDERDDEELHAKDPTRESARWREPYFRIRAYLWPFTHLLYLNDGIKLEPDGSQSEPNFKPCFDLSLTKNLSSGVIFSILSSKN